MNWALFIGILSLIVGIWAHFKNFTLQKKIVHIEEEKEKDRKVTLKRAEIRANFLIEHDLKGNRHEYVQIENYGHSTAIVHDIKLDGISIEEYHANLGEKKMVNIIGPNSEVRYKLFFTMENFPTSLDFYISWNDESGEKREYQTTLTTM